jgi:VanZ family protein
MILRFGGRNNDQPLYLDGGVCIPELRGHLSDYEKDSERAMDLFLEIFRLSRSNCPDHCLDHVSFSKMNHSSPVLLWGAAILYAVVIFWISSLSDVPAAPRNVDKVFHFFEYFLFAFLLWRALRTTRLRRSMLRSALIVFAIGAAYAASDEFHQFYVPGRTCSVFDWAADVAGIVGMLTLILIAVKWRGKAFNYDSI